MGTRIFNGKKYHLGTAYRTKAEAKKRADGLKAAGFKARIVERKVKGKTQYVIYKAM